MYPFKKYPGLGGSLVGTGAGVKYLSDRSAKGQRREVRRLQLKEKKDTQLFIHGALEDGQSKKAILQDLDATGVHPGAPENLTLEVNKEYVDSSVHVPVIGNVDIPIVGKLGFGQQLYHYRLIEKNPAIVNENLKQVTPISFLPPKVKKLSSKNALKSSHYLNQNGSLNCNTNDLNFSDSIFSQKMATKEKGMITSVRGGGHIISEGSFIKDRSGLSQSIALFLFLSLIGAPILDMIQRFIRNRIFPKIPILKNYSGKNSELLQLEERLKFEILKSSELQLSPSKNVDNYKMDIIFLIYLLEKDKITKKEAFKILENKHSLDANSCETLLFKKESLLEIETDILSNFSKFYK